MTQELTCIVCPMGCQLTIDEHSNVQGNLCKRGISYAIKELSNPTRTITSTVKIRGGLYQRIPVKTSGEIPKEDIFLVMKRLDGIELEAPIENHHIVIENILGTSINVITTRSMKKVLQ